LMRERKDETGRVVGLVKRVHYYVGPLTCCHVVYKCFL
jgi:hypothetical protein